MQTVLVLDVQGIRVRLRAEDARVGRVLREVVAYFGLPVSEAPLGPAQASLDLAVWERLPTLPPTARRVAQYGRHVEIWRTGDAFVLRSARALVEVDPAAGRAAGGVIMQDDPALRSEVLADVVLGLFLLLRPHGFFPLHAAALVQRSTPNAWAHGEAEGVLFVAESDSGKSTTAYQLVRQGWSYLSDDSILLQQRNATIEAVAFRRHFGLDPDARDRFPEVATHWSAQLTDVDKRCVPMDALYPEQAADRCVPRLLVFPELVAETESRLVPLRKSEAMLRLVAQSALVTLDAAWTPAHLDALKTLVNQAASYRLFAAADLLRDPSRIVSLLEARWPASSPSYPPSLAETPSPHG